ncbi:hypothetical protein V12B01_13465 [Vibrio splendidus 12B01]|nr:hypothetical protein V12B01_13465 [Vibrio splendidus 12B01]
MTIFTKSQVTSQQTLVIKQPLMILRTKRFGR